MGVPAFFRWLSKKYPSIVVEVDPNVDVEYVFDNLYLDMNGIIHPCTHPEYKQAPETEEEMFDAIFEYIDKLMKIMKPRKLLYMAVDGVAPRAKMNQQRSRRFRAAKESVDKKLEIQKIKDDLRLKGIPVEEGEKKAHFDSNVITPGTPFMVNLSRALQAWIDKKFDHSQNDEESNKLWHKDLVVILSDASSPGEGEHKIMEYIRRQKSQPNYDPNISHCLCGADADLIMLGLATHELNFTIIREEFIPNQPRPCEICGQYNHEMKECEGKPADPNEEIFVPVEPGFIFIRLNVLREYLEIEAKADNLDLERFIDDFVFLCFFVGNDFLPHLPSLEIREGAIDRLVKLYKSVIKRDESDFYMTRNGIVNLKRVQPLLHRLGELEDEIFRRRSDNDKRYRKRIKNERESRAKQAERIRKDAASGSPWLAPQVVGPRGQKPDPMIEPRTEAYNVRMMNSASSSGSALKSMLREEGSEELEQKGTKRPHSESEGSEDSEIDEVMLGSTGWKERYYYHKFDTPNPEGISEIIAKEYVIGFCWVLLYYYQGCPDWQWFYPFHYAPFASDFTDIDDVEVKFNRNSRPFKPLEQLMSVFPAASSKSIPDPWKRLMMDPESKIIDFYPETFKIDLNGKMHEWQGVALLPFIDEERLHEALEPLRSLLDDSERERNSLGPHLVFISKKNSEAYNYLDPLFERQNSEELPCDPERMGGLAGAVKHNKKYSHQNSRCVEFFDPVYEKDFIFPAKKLPNADPPPKTLKGEEIANWKPMIGMSHLKTRATLGQPGHRFISHHTQNHAQQPRFAYRRP